MSHRVDSIAQNVKGESENMRTKFTDLEKNLKDLSSGGLFGQIDSMIQELKRLNELNDKYEVRYFLTCTELERRALMVNECAVKIQQLETDLRHQDIALKDTQRLRTEETSALKRQIEVEVHSAQAVASNEQKRLERRIQELQGELSRRDHHIEELNRNLAQSQDAVNKLRREGQVSNDKQQELQRQYEEKLVILRSDHTQEMRLLEAKYQTDMENLRRQLEGDRDHEVEKQKRLISEYYTQQISHKDSELSKFSQNFDSMRNRMSELERENQGLHSQNDHSMNELSDLKLQLVSLRKSHEEYNVKINETHRIAIQKALSEKEKELRDKLELELSKLEKELKEKKALVLTLEQKVIFTEKENQRNAARLSDMTVERDELKSKLIDAEKRMTEEIRIVEETLTIQVQESQSEIERLVMQNREMSERFNMQMEQERDRANSSLLDNDMLRKEITKLKELSDQRNREIEEWRTKYRGYITGEEASGMRDELIRLRKLNMDYEDEIARLRSDIAKINERMRNFAIEMETKDHEMHNLSELVNRRKQEVLSTQQENDRLMTMLRNMTDQKDTVDAQKLMTEEKYMKMDREIQQLKHERDRFKSEYEKGQILLQHANKKIADNSIQMEEMALNASNSQRISTTTSTMRTSNMYGSKAYDPNYRGEAFGK